MNAATSETVTTAPCPRCHGTGSGLYNVFSLDSTCEACEGTGFAVPPQTVKIIPHASHTATRPRSVEQ